MFVTFWQYIPSVEDTVLGIVVDTKPDVSIHLPLEVLPPFQNIRCFSFVKQVYLDIF
jgi:exosome complex RNA-binding protein Rrp4